MPTNTEIVVAGYQAFAEQDMPTLLGLFDPDIEWYIPDELPEGGTYRGPDGVLQFFGTLQETYTEFRVEPEQFSADENDRVLVEGHHRGRLGDQTFDVAFIQLWTLRNGLAVAFREFCDSGKLLVLFQHQSAVHH
ncbi:nuclear transport factor 2 family protein [Actinomycetospora sp. C-140]